MQIFSCFSTKKYDEEKQRSIHIEKSIKTWYKSYQHAIKILLLGPGESGKTTILKQMKILHVQGFSEEDRLAEIPKIRGNVHESVFALIRNLLPLGLTPQDETQNVIFRFLEIGPIYNEEYFDAVRLIWQDPAVKECLRRSNEFQLIDSAEYFLERIEKIRQPDYIPEESDILQCRQCTTGIQKIQFTVKVPKSIQGGWQEFWMFDVGGQRGERKKWIQVFEGIHAIWFIVASSNFDQTLREDNQTNRLRESVAIFEDVWRSRFLLDAGMIIFLNKQDLLEKKIREGRQIGKYFPEYETFEYPGDKKRVSVEQVDEYVKAKYFIRHLMMQVTQKTQTDTLMSSSSLQVETVRPRDCYYHFTVATDTNNIKTVFSDIHHLILTKTLFEIGML